MRYLNKHVKNGNLAIWRWVAVVDKRSFYLTELRKGKHQSNFKILISIGSNILIPREFIKEDNIQNPKVKYIM